MRWAFMPGQRQYQGDGHFPALPAQQECWGWPQQGRGSPGLTTFGLLSLACTPGGRKQVWLGHCVPPRSLE